MKNGRFAKRIEKLYFVAFILINSYPVLPWQMGGVSVDYTGGIRQ